LESISVNRWDLIHLLCALMWVEPPRYQHEIADWDGVLARVGANLRLADEVSTTQGEISMPGRPEVPGAQRDRAVRTAAKDARAAARAAKEMERAAAKLPVPLRGCGFRQRPR
jgi:hypothetical protein